MNLSNNLKKPKTVLYVVKLSATIKCQHSQSCAFAMFYFAEFVSLNLPPLPVLWSMDCFPHILHPLL